MHISLRKLGVGNDGVQRLAEFGTLHPTDEDDDR
jgi:hypothetical protein